MDLYGAIEGGGTKFVCAIGDSSGKIIEKIKISTQAPEITSQEIISFFKQHPIKKLGIGCFGPLDLNKNSATYGSITSTPKPGWSGFNILRTLKQALNVEVILDTDVNGAALGEYYWGLSKQIKNLVYITIGTGIGAGILVNGETVKGLLHPEAGHMFISQRKDDNFEGTCPFHGNLCFEGLANGPAIKNRWHVEHFSSLEKDHPAVDLEAHYIAMALVNIICTCSPELIIIGGGVTDQKALLPKVREKTVKLLNGYVRHDRIEKEIDKYIILPTLNENSGIMGALTLAII